MYLSYVRDVTFRLILLWFFYLWNKVYGWHCKYYFLTCTYNIRSGISWRTYAIISWWCRIHVFNLACKSQFAIVWTCSSSFAWWGVICCCLISNMATFSLSNWLHATATRLKNRDMKPNFIPSTSNVTTPCKEANTRNYNADMCLTPSTEHCQTTNFAENFVS